MKLSHALRPLGCLVFLGVFQAIIPTALAQEEQDSELPAVILRIEGDGIAKVKKSFGSEEVAGARGKVFPGDRVITDERSAVFLTINDGSVIKVGFNSEFKVEKSEIQNRFVAWAFRVVRGSIRAMVEKNPEKDTRFKVNTPGGTIGVRGTEFVVVVDDAAKSSQIFTIEGLVVYGAVGCEKNNSCLDVRAGESSSMKEGNAPSRPEAYRASEVLGVTAGGGDIAKNSARQAPARLSLFRDAKKASVRGSTSLALDEASLLKLLGDASAELAENQDRVIGRTKEERVAVQEAIKAGTWNSTMAAAEDYAAKTGTFSSEANGRAENLVAQTAAAKFRLGTAVKQSQTAGLFAKSSAGEESYTLKKNMGYEKAAEAKELRAKLEKAEDTYKNVIEVAEADKTQPAAAQKEEEPKDNDTSATGEKESTTGAVIKVAPGCDSKCMAANVKTQASAVIDKVVSIFSARNSSEIFGEKAFATTTSRPIKTRIAERRYGECLKSAKDCKLIPCSGYAKGGKCRRGESVLECSSKKAQATCERK